MDKLIFKSLDKDYIKYDFHITWTLTDVCQLKCSYCFRKEEPILPFLLGKTIYTINQLNELSKHKKIKIILTGGEPLLFPYFNLIEDNLNSNIDLDLNTNGFLLGDDFNYDRYTMLSVSWHSEYFDGLIKKIPILKKLNEQKKLNVNVVYNQENLEIVKKIQKMCESENLSYALVLDLFENKKIDIETKNDNNEKIYQLTYKGKTYMKNNHDLWYLAKKNKIFQNSFCTNNFVSIETDFSVKYACYIKNIESIESLIDLDNKVFCKKPMCPNLTCYGDTTKMIWEKDKINLLINS